MPTRLLSCKFILLLAPIIKVVAIRSLISTLLNFAIA